MAKTPTWVFRPPGTRSEPLATLEIWLTATYIKGYVLKGNGDLNPIAYVRARRNLVVWGVNEIERQSARVCGGVLPEGITGPQRPKKCVVALRPQGDWLAILVLAFCIRGTAEALLLDQSANAFEVAEEWWRHCAGYTHALCDRTRTTPEPFVYLDAEFSDRAVRRLAALEIEPEFNVTSAWCANK